MLFISDSRSEKQPINEANNISIFIIALSDTNNLTKYVDLIMLLNNREEDPSVYLLPYYKKSSDGKGRNKKQGRIQVHRRRLRSKAEEVGFACKRSG